MGAREVIRQLFYLGVYCLVALSSFVWLSYIRAPIDWLVLAEGAALIILGLSGIILLTYFLRNYRPRELVVVLPGVFAMFVGMVILWLTQMLLLRFVFSSVFIAVFIVVYNFVLYFEDIFPPQHSHRELMHHRYIEYGRTLFWTVVVILIAYHAWEMQAEVYKQFRTQLSDVPALLQLVSVFGAGGCLAFLAFHNKLSEIERQK